MSVNLVSYKAGTMCRVVVRLKSAPAPKMRLQSNNCTFHTEIFLHYAAENSRQFCTILLKYVTVRVLIIAVEYFYDAFNISFVKA